MCRLYTKENDPLILGSPEMQHASLPKNFGNVGSDPCPTGTRWYVQGARLLAMSNIEMPV